MFYKATKGAFRAVVPPAAKRFFFNGKTPFSRAVLAIKGRMERSADHAEIYDAKYYDNYTAEMERSAVAISASVIEAFHPKDVIDIGCGSGEILAELTKRGVSVRGFDLSPASLEICRDKGLYVDCLDLEEGSIPACKTDVVISTEVAEHLPANCADHYVRLLSSMARTAIVMTAATPGQGGTDHVNEQPNEYWIEKFERNGARFSRELTDRFRSEWQEKVESSRANNVLVFKQPYP